MRIRVVALVTVLVFTTVMPVTVVAATPPEDPFCKATSDQITDQLKELSLLTAQGELEDSALRQAAREGKKNGILSTINIALTQMTARGCKPFSLPIRDDLFKDPATLCVWSDKLAQMKANNAAAWAAHDADKHPTDGDAPHGVVPECNRSGWKADNL